MNANSPTPAGYRSVTAYLIVQDAAPAIEYYVSVFGGRERLRLPGPHGRIGHAEIELGDSLIMLADACPETGARSPEALGGSPISLLLYVPNVDDVVARAAAAGAQILRPLKDQFYGDRSATLLDPFGHTWTIATHLEDVPAEELERRAQARAEEFEQISSGHG